MAATKHLPQRVQDIIAKNEVFAASYPAAVPKMVDMRARSRSTGTGLAIITCMDPRVVPEDYFGPDLRAAVLRNAGGHARPDTIASLVLFRSLSDFKTVAVVQHTDCGATHLTDDQITREAKERTPKAAAEIDAMHFGCFKEQDLENSVKVNVDILRATTALEGVQVLGFVLETETGVARLLDY
ncbi:hypothetical protein FH972_021651 [Carpinus fangiana]|uniref:Carbonic anhydrase n=1 Tax=Carpinus fangiana TaxID=176857 RepID=A0A5N6KPX2_9ROSI|nr:hypothetical protein FH972_021651 [Carpinus fangiana]